MSTADVTLAHDMIEQEKSMDISVAITHQVMHELLSTLPSVSMYSHLRRKPLFWQTALLRQLLGASQGRTQTEGMVRFANKDSEFIIDLSIMAEKLQERQKSVRKSKLETYEVILEALVSKPLTFECIANESGTDSDNLQQHLEFLMKNDLVEERTSGKKATYAITERGIAILRALNFQKYLGKIKNKLRAIDEAMQVIPEISERGHSFKEEAKD